PVDPEHDPSRYDLFPTDALEIGGKFFKTYTTVSGIGAPIAVVGRTESPQFRQQYKLPRVYAPVTAIVRFSGRQARLEFIDPLKTERITLNKQVFPLAADFDAPTALLIAHSMGGLICRLMITDTGDKIWRDYFATPPAKTPLAPDTRKLLEEALVFNHRPDVERVIFISTPHRGSKLAVGWIGRIGAALIRTPQFLASIYTSTKPLLIADPAARPLNRMPNSVDTLEPNDRFVEAVNKLP